MEVRAFKAFRYDKAVVGDAGECIAPPYDVIDASQQQQLYEKNEYNIVRIIKGKAKPTDNGSDNVYTRAAEHLDEWIAKGVLKQDEVETIYAYVQDFELSGKQYQRLGFTALLKLEEFGDIVRPHEKILNKPIVDRLNLKRATSARFGLVFMLYDDADAVADKIITKAAARDPLIDFVDEQQVRHRLFAITEKPDIDAIAKMMSDKSCIIADGHHRYTTGLAYMKENPNPAARYQMITFVNTRHEGLVVLATHRVVKNLEDFDIPKLLAGLQKNFQVSEYQFDSAAQQNLAKQKMLLQMKAEYDNDRTALGIYAGGNAFYTAVLKDNKAMDQAAPGTSQAWKSLDVSVLHKLILEQILAIDDAKLADGDFLEYAKDSGSKVEELIKQVDAGARQAAFFMNPPKMEQIQKTADAGERMPQKSTYFYPKLFTGLTINKL